jgi:hypothetical protein
MPRSSSSTLRPPQFNATISLTRTARFQASGVAHTGLSVTRGMLLNHLFVNAANALVNYRVVSGIRIRKVRMWAIGNAVAAPVTLSIEWLSTLGPSKFVSASSMSVEPAFIRSAPPLLSTASFWSLTGFNETEVLFVLDYVIGTVIDLQYEVYFQNGETPVTVTTANNGTAGNLYMSPLDGVGAGRELLPTSYFTNF